jgi:predicted membrane channel-forming protein YqfA (hemolysin III family)
MRETPTTLSAYFIVNGALGALSGLAGSAGMSRMAVPGTNIFAAVYFIVSLAFAAVFIVVGIFLRRLLARSPRTIKIVLWASFGCVVLAFLLSSLIRVQPAAAVLAVVSVLILWYLLRSVNRLAAEAHSAASYSKT